MTTQEVDELIKQEIYENNVGHITGTVLSAVLQEINNKRLTSYDIFGSTFSENQDFISAFASTLDSTGLLYNRTYPDAQSALQSTILVRLNNDIKNDFTFDSSSPGEFVSAIMNRMGYVYQAFNPVFNMFQSAIASAVEAELNKFSNDDTGAMRIVSAIVERITKNQFGIETGLGTNYYNIGNFPAVFLASACANLDNGQGAPYWPGFEDKYINYHNLTTSIMKDMGYQYGGNLYYSGWNMFRSAIMSALIDRKTRDGDNNGYRYLGSNLIEDTLFVSGIFVSMLNNSSNYGHHYNNLDEIMFDFASAIFNSAINYNRFDETTMRNLASAIKSYL